jgi:hypothetical protein
LERGLRTSPTNVDLRTVPEGKDYRLKARGNFPLEGRYNLCRIPQAVWLERFGCV